MEDENFTWFLLYGCRLAEKMASQLNVNRAPYWVRCMEALTFMINKQISQVFDKRNTPEEERFVKIRAKFIELYNFYQEELSQSFIGEIVDGKRMINDSWLKFDGDADYDECDDRENDEGFNENITNEAKRNNVTDLKNRGICITICEKNETYPYDIEFPISEMYHTALFIRQCGFKQINYPSCVLFFLYGCIYYSVPDCNRQVLKDLNGFRKHSCLKPSNFFDQFPSSKSRVEKLMENNREFFSSISETVISGIDDVKDEEIEDLSAVAKDSISLMEKNNGDIFELISSFMPGSDNSEIKEKIQEFNSEENKTNIGNLINYISSSDSKVEDMQSAKTLADIMKLMK